VLSQNHRDPNQQMGHNYRTEKNPVPLLGIEPLAVRIHVRCPEASLQYDSYIAMYIQYNNHMQHILYFLHAYTENHDHTELLQVIVEGTEDNVVEADEDQNIEALTSNIYQNNGKFYN